MTKFFLTAVMLLCAVPGAEARTNYGNLLKTDGLQIATKMLKEVKDAIDDVAALRAPAGLADTLRAAAPNKGNRPDWDYSYIADAAARTFMEDLDRATGKLAERGWTYSQAVIKARKNGDELRDLIDELPNADTDDAERAFDKYNAAQDAIAVSLSGLGADRFVEAYVHDTLQKYYLMDPVLTQPLAPAPRASSSGASSDDSAASAAHAAAMQLAAERAAAVAAGNPLTASDLKTLIGWMNRRVNAANQPYCYRLSSGRGAGVPLSSCDANTEKDGALCYPKCKAGYKGVGPVCWQSCPAGYVDTGAFCHVDKALTKNGDWSCPEWYSCRKVCPSGYTNAGVFCALTTPSNPPGWKGDGLDLIKDSYGRGAGGVLKCAANEEQSGALCYPKCDANYHGVGPVCWQNCSADKVDCGVGCARDKSSCASSTVDMVISPLMLAANILTLGGSSEVEAAQAELKTAAKAGDTAATKAAFGRMLEGYADNLAKMTTADVAKAIEAKLAKNAARWVTKEYAKVQYYLKVKSESGGPTAESFARDLAGLDPTGVASVVEAYTQPKCAADEPMPAVTPL